VRLSAKLENTHHQKKNNDDGEGRQPGSRAQPDDAQGAAAKGRLHARLFDVCINGALLEQDLTFLPLF
jgi:hypothetical protein